MIALLAHHQHVLAQTVNLQIRGEIRVVDLNAIQADVTICVEPLPEGESAQLSFGGLCRWTR